jgi:hypothetical protein
MDEDAFSLDFSGLSLFQVPVYNTECFQHNFYFASEIHSLFAWPYPYLTINKWFDELDASSNRSGHISIILAIIWIFLYILGVATQAK